VRLKASNTHSPLKVMHLNIGEVSMINLAKGYTEVDSRFVFSLTPTYIHQAFLKKLAMLPCPLATPFFPFAVLGAGFGVGLIFFGSGSSSENDSQTVSSLVTVRNQRHRLGKKRI
jgi:hypothetical protein